ncbi:MAG: GYF domain-containing protein [Nannocystaceae bacterium]
MKIECEKCQAKYSIADEKVRGKTFKIRCKKCSNVIIVRNKDAATKKEDAADAPDRDDGGDPGWHLAIDGETVGPVAEEDLRSRYAAGEIDKDTAVWREGFEDWSALGEMKHFADLPDPLARRAPTESASAPAGAVVSGFSGGGSSFGGQGQPGGGPAQSSPRVDGAHLTAQRNENSVLFSLDNLREMAGASVDTRAAPRNAGLATVAPTSEGSGLIDIRALSGLAGGTPAPQAEQDDALPSFGGGAGFAASGGLAPSALVPASAAPLSGEPQPARSMTAVYVLMGFMALLLLVMGGFVVSLMNRAQPQGSVVVREVPGKVVHDVGKARGAQESADNKGEDQEDDPEKKGVERTTDERGAARSDDSKTLASAVKPSNRRTNKRRKSGQRAGGSRSSATGGGSKPSAKKTPPKSAKEEADELLAEIPAPTTKSASGGGGASDVDCLLDPSLPGCGSGAKKKGRSSKKGKSKKKSSSSSDASLPASLDKSAAMAGLRAVKPAAKKCGQKHGASPGTKVLVKLSIQGSTGRATSATPKAPWSGKPLGNCVAAAAKKARFPKFKKVQQGLTYPFRM